MEKRSYRLVMMRYLLLITGFFMLFSAIAFADEGNTIGVVGGEYGGITGSPVFVKADKAGMFDPDNTGSKQIAYVSHSINTDQTTDDRLVLKNIDGTDVAGWPFTFPRNEWCSGQIAVDDVDCDGKYEIIVRGGIKDSSTYFIRAYERTDSGPAICFDLPIAIDPAHAQKAPDSFWTSDIAVSGSFFGKGAISYETLVMPNGEQKSLLEGLQSSGTPFIVGTPVFISLPTDVGQDIPVLEEFVVFQAVEVPDLQYPDKDITHAVYCVKVNLLEPNVVRWRVALGTTQYTNYAYSSWAELGAGDLNGDGWPEVVATFPLDNQFNYRVIGGDGTVLSSKVLPLLTSSSEHARFVIADIGNVGPDWKRSDVIFFKGYGSTNFTANPYSQSACTFIDQDGTLDFLMRGQFRDVNGSSITAGHGFFIVSPYLADAGSALYEPIIYSLQKDAISTTIQTDTDTMSYYGAVRLSHVVAADVNSDGNIHLAGVQPSGVALDVVRFGSVASDCLGWLQGYGASDRTNQYSNIAQDTHAPSLEIIPAGPKYVLAGEKLEFQIITRTYSGQAPVLGSDIFFEGIHYTLKEELHYAASNYDGGYERVYTFSWTPQNSDAAIYADNLTCTDGRNTTQKPLMVTVNRPPVALLAANQSAVERSAVILDGSASYDPDSCPEPLTYNWTQVSGPQMTLNKTDPARPTFMAPDVQRGSVDLGFSLTVYDGKEYSQASGIIVRINDIDNRPPSIQAISDKTIMAGNNLQFDVIGTDPDGDYLTYSIEDPPAQATMTTIYKPNTGLFSWNVLESQEGEHVVRVAASDGVYTAYTDVRIAVTINHAPVFQGLADKTVTAGSLLEFDIVATDQDGDMLSYAAWPIPEGASLSFIERSPGYIKYHFRWQTSSSQTGDFSAQFYVTDLKKSTIAQINIKVTAPQTAKLKLKKILDSLKKRLASSASKK